jgi:hypothetical protein
MLEKARSFYEEKQAEAVDASAETASQEEYRKWAEGGATAPPTPKKQEAE